MAVPKWAVSADSLSATGLTGSAYAAPVQSSARMATLAIVLSIVARLGRNAGLTVISKKSLDQALWRKDKSANFGHRAGGRWPGGQALGLQTGCLNA